MRAMKDRLDIRKRRGAPTRLVKRDRTCAGAQNGSRPMERDMAKAGLREAVAMYGHAVKERDRRKAVLEQGAISRMEFDAADREYSVADARLEGARQHLALVDAEPRTDEIHRIQADLDQAKQQASEALKQQKISQTQKNVVTDFYKNLAPGK